MELYSPVRNKCLISPRAVMEVTTSRTATSTRAFAAAAAVSPQEMAAAITRTAMAALQRRDFITARVILNSHVM